MMNLWKATSAKKRARHQFVRRLQMELLESRRLLATTITLVPNNDYSHTEVKVTYETRVPSTVSTETFEFNVKGPGDSTVAGHTFELDAIRQSDLDTKTYPGLNGQSTLNMKLPLIPLAPGSNAFTIKFRRINQPFSADQTQEFLNAPQVVTVRNRLPILTPAASLSTNEGIGITVLTLSDPDNDTISVPSLSAINGSVTFNSVSRTIFYQPSTNFFGNDTIVVTASDGLELSTRTITVSVLPINDAPTLASIANPSPILEDSALQTVSLSGISAGPNESQALTITAVSSNPGLIPNPTISYASPSATGSLAYTPVADQSGTAVITVTVTDNGGTANGGADTTTRSFTITVSAVNDPPLHNPISGLTIKEDAAEQTVNLTGILAGGGESQPLRITASSSNTGLIATPMVNYTSATTTGSLTFTPASNEFGFSVLFVTVEDGGLDGSLNTGADNATFVRSFTVTVDPVNDSPTLNSIANPAALPKNAAPQTVSLSGISAGPNETQVLTVTATSSNPGLIPDPVVSYTSANPTGSLVFTPVPNQSGTATITVTVVDNGGTSDGGVDTFIRTFSIAIDTVNRTPTLDLIPNPTAIDEDASERSVNLTGITVGLNETLQQLTVSAVSSNPGLIPNPTITYTSPNATGTLFYRPVANQSGTAIISVTAMDDGGTAGGGVDVVVRSFTVTVNPINDSPTLDSIADPAPIPGNAGQQTINLTGISSGPSETQFLTVTAKSSNPSLIPDPIVNYTSPNSIGTLLFSPATNVSATATITVAVKEDDGTVNGVTVSRSFTVTVQKFNFPPSFSSALDLKVLQSGVLNIDGTVGAVDPEGNAVVASSILIPVLPQFGTAILQTIGGIPTIVYTPLPSFQGVDQFQYTIADDLGSRSAPRTVMVGIVDRPLITALVDDVLPATGTLPFTTQIFTNDVLPVLSGTAEPGAQVQLVSQPAITLPSVTADVQGRWQIALTSPLPASRQSYSLFVNATSAGVPVFKSDSVVFTVDTTTPAATSTLKSELRKSSLSEDVVFRFSEPGNGADPVVGFGLEDLTLTVSGNAANLIAGSTATLQPNTAGNFFDAFTLKGLATVTEKSGTYALRLNAGSSGIADRASNLLATSLNTSFAVDKDAPKLSTFVLNTAVVGGSKLPVQVVPSTNANGASVSYATTISDQQFAGFPNAVSAQIVSVNGNVNTPLGTKVSIPIASGSQDKLNFAPATVNLSVDLPIGQSEFKVVLTDAAGNSSTSTSFFVFVSGNASATEDAPGTPVDSTTYFLGARLTADAVKASNKILVNQSVRVGTTVRILDEATSKLESLVVNQSSGSGPYELTLSAPLVNSFSKATTTISWLRTWTMSFDKTTQTTWFSNEDGNYLGQFDPATGEVKLYDVVLPGDLPTSPATVLPGTTNRAVSYDPHGVFFDFNTHLTPRIWFVYRNANGDGDTPGVPDNALGFGRLGYFDLATKELHTLDLSKTLVKSLDGKSESPIKGTHAVFIDTRGHAWISAEETGAVIEIDLSKIEVSKGVFADQFDLNASERKGIVVVHRLPTELADIVAADGKRTELDFKIHGIQVVVDRRNGESYVWLADGNTASTGRVVLLRPGSPVTNANKDGRSQDQWFEWIFDDAMKDSSGNVVINSQPLFLSLDDNETPGIPEDDRIIIPDGGTLNSSTGLIRILDANALISELVTQPPASLFSKALPKSPLLTTDIPKIPGAQSRLTQSVPNQSSVDRLGTIYFSDALGSVGRFSFDDKNLKLKNSIQAPIRSYTNSFQVEPIAFSTRTKPNLLEFVAETRSVAGDAITKDRSQASGVDQYEVAQPSHRGRGEGAFRMVLNAENTLHTTLSQSDHIAVTAFAESNRRNVAALASPFELPKGARIGGRAVLQVLRDGSVVLTARGDGELLDEQVNLTKALLNAGKIASFDDAAVLGDMAALVNANGAIEALGRLADGRLIRYTFTPPTKAWKTADLKNVAFWTANTKLTIPSGQLAAEDPAPAPGIGFTITTSSGHLIVIPPGGTPVDLSAAPGRPAVYSGVGGVKIGDKLRFYGSNQTGNVIEYSTDLNLGNVSTRTLVLPNTVDVRETRMLRNIRPLIDGTTLHLFGTDGVSRLVHYELNSAGTVTLAENLTQVVQKSGDVFGYFDLQQPYGGRVYTYVSAIRQSDGTLRVYGTNGGELIEFTRDTTGKWRVGNLTNDINSTHGAATGSRTPANFVFGSPSVYQDQLKERHILQINADGEIIEYYTLANDPQNRLHTQNVNLRLGNDSLITNLRFRATSLQTTASVNSNSTVSSASAPGGSASNFAAPYVGSLDVNADGELSPLDVLLVINYLNAPTETNRNGDGESSGNRLDVNGDGWISPLDVLMLVNHLNGFRSGNGAEGEGIKNDSDTKSIEAIAVDLAFSDLGLWDNLRTDVKKQRRMQNR